LEERVIPEKKIFGIVSGEKVFNIDVYDSPSVV